MRHFLLTRLIGYRYPSRGASLTVACPCGFKRLEGSPDELLRSVGALCLGCGRTLQFDPPELAFMQ